jgi:hypothetical protein
MHNAIFFKFFQQIFLPLEILHDLHMEQNGKYENDAENRNSNMG